MNLNGDYSKVFKKYGMQITEAMKQDMRIDNTKATGEALASVDFIGKKVGLEIQYNSTVSVLHTGLEKGQTFPSINSIVKWMNAKGIQPRDYKTGAFIKGTKSNMRSAGFLIARAIHRNGTIKRFGYKGTGVKNIIRDDKYMIPLKKELGAEIGSKLLNDLVTEFQKYGFSKQ